VRAIVNNIDFATRCQINAIRAITASENCFHRFSKRKNAREMYAADEQQQRESHTCGAGVPPKTGFRFSLFLSLSLARSSRMHLHAELVRSLYLPTTRSRARIFRERSESSAESSLARVVSFASKDLSNSISLEIVSSSPMPRESVAADPPLRSSSRFRSRHSAI